MIAALAAQAKTYRVQIQEIESLVEDDTTDDLREAAYVKVTALRRELYHTVSRATYGRYNADDVELWVQHVKSMGGVFPVLGTKLIGELARIERVPNAPLRNALYAYVEAGGSYAEVVRTAHERLVQLEREWDADFGSEGWRTGGTQQKTDQALASVQWALGMSLQKGRQGAPFCAFLLPYQKAVALSRALGVDPQQAGV